MKAGLEQKYLWFNKEQEDLKWEGRDFMYNPEHIIEKENKKMVACVNSFLQVRVAYYDYVNCFVRGNQVRISEDYGSGGYDPFEIDKMPSPQKYIYYDENGNIIKSNW